MISAAALGVTTLATGQTNSSGTGALETVVVTGIRAGIEEAIELKRQSSSIVEAISAEDLGKLPDRASSPTPASRIPSRACRA
jgi:iron complex outermembrane recepter protein